MKINPNPQGKGVVVLMGALAEAKSLIQLPPKTAEQISVELFTSLFVLQSEFKFKPVVGRHYWLYFNQGLFKLSLVAPEEGGSYCFGLPVGKSILQDDITWSLELSDEAQADIDLMSLIQSKQKEFESRLKQADSIDKALPFYREKLPFYQRIFAAGLAQSLSKSAQYQGIADLTYDAALKCLSQNKGHDLI